MASLPLLLLTDARFPAGGYAHSGGLEAAVEDGLGRRRRRRVPRRAAPRRRLAGGRARRRAARARDASTGCSLLDLEAAARCPSPPLRAAASRLGAQLLRTAATVWPDER